MTSIQILPHTAARSKYFDSINRAWVAEMFVVEPIDDAILKDPQTHIIAPGGDILYVALPGDEADAEIIGAGALRLIAPGVFELTKMGVTKAARGKKAGETLLKALISRAKELDAKLLFLLTNADCKAAIHLYEKNDFDHDAEIAAEYGPAYERCNVAMRYRHI